MPEDLHNHNLVIPGIALGRGRCVGQENMDCYPLKAARTRLLPHGEPMLAARSEFSPVPRRGGRSQHASKMQGDDDFSGDGQASLL